jgi:CRP-like cAMP-binding protein
MCSLVSLARYDLLYEWMVEIRSRVLLSEYLTIWGTFIAIQVVGVDAGIIIGVLVAVVDNVVNTAQTTTVRKVHKRSRAIWTPAENKILQRHGYFNVAPKIVTFEIRGPVFFGSSLALLEDLVREIGLQESQQQPDLSSSESAVSASPHHSSFLLVKDVRQRSFLRDPNQHLKPKAPPKYVVLDFSQITNMDASAARTCFLQLCAVCKKQGIVVCAAGVTPRMVWVLRSHHVAYEHEDAETMKAQIQTPAQTGLAVNHENTRMLLFLTLHEALEFCENALVRQFVSRGDPITGLKRSSSWSELKGLDNVSMSHAFARILNASVEEKGHLEQLDGLQYHEELEFNAGEKIFTKGSHPNSFYVVLSGAVASDTGNVGDAVYRNRQQILSGAGPVDTKLHSSTRLSVEPSTALDPGFTDKHGPVVATLWEKCGVFGYTDLLLDRPRTFSATAAQDGTRLARMSRVELNSMSSEPALSALVHRVLLQASLSDLQNCTCDDV